MMFYGDGDQVTLDRNYFHDCSGRAPKLGEDSTGGTFVRYTPHYIDRQQATQTY